jgi:two-component system chemotaxis response regulator CheY
MTDEPLTDEVLVVDDQQAMRLLLVGLLRNLKFANIRQAASGRKALEMMKTSMPDIVFLDLMMPDMHGLDVLGELRALPQGERAFVIVQTGSATKENVERARDLDVGGVLVKPYNFEKVRTAVGRYRSASADPG